MLGFPSSVKYINRANRPERIFASRVSDRSLYEPYISVDYDSSGDGTDSAMRWSQDAPQDRDVLQSGRGD